MGEVVMSYEEGVEERENVERESGEKKEGTSSMVRWERFLPRVALRVLLVEADDSTRQIIGALLRKCNYKVASVPDGLKAWEVLKARPHNIDLILTEVELPSISGYALLTLIMEHEICKNIPVIMMSKHDSVSTVYKCMLKGAADFLVKPIRINELKNLWQHVWRRQSSRREGSGPQDDSVAQEKLEATAENNATSDHSSSAKTCAPRQDDCIKKGSDAQSSCGKPDLEAESGYIAEVDDRSQPNQGKSQFPDFILQEHNNYANSGHNRTPDNAVPDTSAYNVENTLDGDRRMEQQTRQDNMNLNTETSDNRDVIASSSRKAMDLIGAFGDNSRHNSTADGRANNFEPAPQLDLSLRRVQPCYLGDKPTYEKQMLNHSNASAFTRYVNKTLHSSSSKPICETTHKENGFNSSDPLPDKVPRSNSNPKEPSVPYDRKVISIPTNLTKEVDSEYQATSQRLFPIPLPVRGMRVDVCGSPSPTPSSANQQMSSFHQFNVNLANSRPHLHRVDQSPRISQDQKFESLEDRAYFSSNTDQSATSTLCNGYATAGSNNVNQDSVVPVCSESGNEQSHANLGLNCQRSLQREAALTKFRLKRKERCYEKKVRYESRKKLAEQRPRVKGQFVRQVPPDPPPPKSDNSGGNSIAN